MEFLGNSPPKMENQMGQRIKHGMELNSSIGIVDGFVPWLVWVWCENVLGTLG